MSVFCLIYSVITDTSFHISSLKHTDQEGSAVLSLKIQKTFSKVPSPMPARETKLPWDENQNSDMTK